MKALLRSLRRAPGRVTASVFAIGLAVGAIGVFAVPDVAAGTLRDLAAEDKLGHLVVDTTPLDAATLQAIGGLDGVDAVDATPTGSAETALHGRVQLVGVDPDQTVNIVNPHIGRLPGAGEALVSPGLAKIGDSVTVGDASFDVVGVGGTAWWSDTAAVYAPDGDIASLVQQQSQQLALTVTDPSSENLEALVPELRAELAMAGATFVSFPELLPDGRHPIEADLEQVSTMIGLLGVVAGIVAMVLLASTASTLITERSREVAVMRALGARRRPLRRRLRRLAVATAVGGLLVGLPLGVLVSNLVARMVLERFVGLTPDVGVSWPVAIGSILFAIVGARLVAARAARRVTKAPLADALRDRAGSTWGRRLGDRLVSRLRVGGVFGRLATRNVMRSRARSVSTVAQIAAGTGAVIVVASLATSVNAFNAGEIEPWNWERTATAVDPGLPFEQESFSSAGIEPAISVEGSLDQWEVNVRGVDADTTMLDTTVEDGIWLTGEDRGVVVSKGFARHQDIAVGDAIAVELASGRAHYDVVGLHRSRARDIYVPVDVLADDLDAPGRANVLYLADGVAPPIMPGAVDVVNLAEMSAEDGAARDAIVAIFGVIGGIVAAVAGLGVASLMAVSMHERRHELAALLAVGGQKRHLRRTLLLELLPLAVVGVGLGIVAGWYGATGIMAAFEQANAVDLGMQFATGAIAPAVIGALVLVALVALASAHRAGRVPPAVTLRAAS